jgi:hypothetical protein
MGGMSGRLWMLVGIGSLVVAGCAGEPFPYVQVSGKVTYEDGTPIPCHRLRVIFVPQTPPIDKKTFPKAGEANIFRDKSPDGSFGYPYVTTYKYDGLIRGKHKVHLDPRDENDQPLHQLIPREMLDPNTSGIEVDTEVQPILIKVKKPAGK